MTTYVINSGTAQATVEIEYPLDASRLDHIFIQPKSKAKVPAGAKVTDGFLMMNPKVKTVKVDDLNEPNSVIAP